MEKRVFFIAEAGVNHNGDINKAIELIDVAVCAGADAVKFQTFNPRTLVTRDAKKARYQTITTGEEESQYEMLRKLRLNKSDHKKLKDYCDEKRIMFISTPFDLESAIFLNTEINVDLFKVGSGDLTNYPLLKYLAETDKPMIVSTGMASLEEVTDAVNFLLKFNKDIDLSLLHCVSSYPTDEQDVNLKAIQTLKKYLGFPVGYSDHTQGIEISLGAVGFGAKIIEKHFTLDKDMEGPDHNASLSPEELIKLVKGIRKLEKATGDGEKICQGTEKENKIAARKSIATKKKIKAGELLTEENITTKRPEKGIKASQYYNVIKKAWAKRDLKEDEIVSWEDIKLEK